MIKVYGKLVEVENRSGYRTAFVLDGRHVDGLDVGKRFEGDLDSMIGKDVEVTCVYLVNWIETVEGRRPSGKLLLTGCEVAGHALAEAA